MAVQVPNARVLVREGVLGYVFWNLFWNLAPTVWFYPLNEMGVTGYEVIAVAWFSPLLLGIPGLGTLLRTKFGLAALRLITVGCLLAHHAPGTLSKLAIAGLGNATLFMSTTVSLWSLSFNVRRATFWGLILGYFATISLRVWCYTFLPVWFTDTTNLVSFSVALVVTIDKIFSGDDSVLQGDKPSTRSSATASTNWVSASAGLASLLYITYWAFGEVSLVSRWVGSTYPSPGPQPLPFGLPILISLAIGLYLGFNYNIVTSLFWWLFGALSFFGLYYLPTWVGYTCGLALGAFTMSLYMFMYDAFTANGQSPPICSQTVFALVFLLQLLFHVWCVAYNFVPGGVFTRERSDALIAAIMVSIGLAIWRNKALVAKKGSKSGPSVRDGGPLVRTFLLIFILVGISGFAYRMYSIRMRNPPSSRPDTIRTAVFTNHFGFDNRGWSNALASIDFVNKTDTDVIAFLESDTSKPFLGNNDLTSIVTEYLGMYGDFGARTSDHCWGVNLMSRYPIVYSEHHLLPSPHGEIAPAIRAGLDVGDGRIVDMIITHMGVEEDDLDRRLQAQALSKILERSGPSAIFLGYITCKPFARDYTELTVKGKMVDIDTTDSDRWCEYILYRGLERLGYARVTHGQLSDTELQMATFKLPPAGASNETLASLSHSNKAVVTDPAKVSEGIRFPEIFGNFAHGHRSYLQSHIYHMSTPKYFLPVTNN